VLTSSAALVRQEQACSCLTFRLPFPTTLLYCPSPGCAASHLHCPNVNCNCCPPYMHACSCAAAHTQVVKNQPAYYHQARVEIGVLQFLNTRADPGDRHHIVRLKVRRQGGREGVGGRAQRAGSCWELGSLVQPDSRMLCCRVARFLTCASSARNPCMPTSRPLRPSCPVPQDFFLYRNHLCLAFELLSLNLYELIKHNKFRGLSLSLVRVFISQVRGRPDPSPTGSADGRAALGRSCALLQVPLPPPPPPPLLRPPRFKACRCAACLPACLPAWLQILGAMVVLRDSRIIHCDLKPENVLLKNVESGGCLWGGAGRDCDLECWLKNVWSRVDLGGLGGWMVKTGCVPPSDAGIGRLPATCHPPSHTRTCAHLPPGCRGGQGD
jgi:hypothetical protein